MTGNKILMIMTAALLAAGSGAMAQIIYGSPAAGGVQFYYTDWTIDTGEEEASISQTTVPVTGFVPLQDNLEALFYAAMSSNSLTQRGNDFSMSGLTDIRVMLNRSFSNDRLLASVGLNLPIGKKKLDLAEEWIIVEYLSQNFLSFPVRRLGEGLGISLMLGGVGMLGELKCGGGIMYQVNGSYEPYDGFEDYNPGDMFSINGGTEYNMNNFALSTNLIYSTYGTDNVDGDKVFEQGDEVNMAVSGFLDNESYDGAVSVRYVWRGRNATYDTTGSVIERLKFYGNEFSIATMVTWYPVKDWSISPGIDYKMIASNENGFGDSKIFGFGARFGRQLNEKTDIGLGVKFYTGNADDSNLDLSGLQITAGISAKL
jgi:hypothetical protein